MHSPKKSLCWAAIYEQDDQTRSTADVPASCLPHRRGLIVFSRHHACHWFAGHRSFFLPVIENRFADWSKKEDHQRCKRATPVAIVANTLTCCSFCNFRLQQNVALPHHNSPAMAPTLVDCSKTEGQFQELSSMVPAKKPMLVDMGPDGVSTIVFVGSSNHGHRF